MKTGILTALGIAMLSCGSIAAQTAVDAYSLTPVQLRGTARFVGMGGAFTSLGGDISSMTQNPAGLGLYRSSDIGLTFDISMRSYKAQTNFQTDKRTETRAYFDSFGYVGVANLGGALRSIQWGLGYSRLASFDRRISGYARPTSTSLSNYIASFTDGVESGYILDADGNDPYASGEDWLSILGYNSFMINNTVDDTQYAGLYQNGTTGDALFDVRERGYVDEYNIDIAGNVSDVVFWGFGVGIVSSHMTRESNYSESMAGALVYDRADDNLKNGNAGFNLYNYQSVSGSGANLKFGVIVRPIEMLRIGAAIHTPTWLHLSHSGFGEVAYNYTPDGTKDTNSDGIGTPDYDYRSRLNTPWRFMVGISTVIGSKAIISLDYERVAYNDMKLKKERYDDYYGYTSDFEDNTYANDDVKKMFRAANIIRVGAEYRILPSLSVRLGYNWQGSAVKSTAYDGGMEIPTNGTNPAFTFNNDTHNICVGLGYRYRSWYIDAAFQHTIQNGRYNAYTPFPKFDGSAMNTTPSAKLTNTYNNIVISTGFRF